MQIGANYLTEQVNGAYVGCYDKVYEILIQKGYLQTLKYPGRVCDLKSLQAFLAFTKKVDAGIDIHGLPGMVPATHCTKLISNINWGELPSTLWANPKFTRISTHIGLDNRQKVLGYSEEEFEENFEQNFQKMKQNLKNQTGREIFFGGENQPGGFEIDPKTLTPEFIGTIWGKMDFGVFDIAHSKNAAKDFGISYEEYLARLSNKERVKILHVSGNTDVSGKYEKKPDKHILTTESELDGIIQALDAFPNLDLVISEYAFPGKYSCQKEIVAEIVTLKTLVETKNVQKAGEMLKLIQQELEDDLENLEQVFTKI